jgi:hypothetical protein
MSIESNPLCGQLFLPANLAEGREVAFTIVVNRRTGSTARSRRFVEFRFANNTTETDFSTTNDNINATRCDHAISARLAKRKPADSQWQAACGVSK